MKQTAMQKHLEWLKARMVITPEMESQLLEEEKQQIINAWNDSHISMMPADQYYNETYKQN